VTYADLALARRLELNEARNAAELSQVYGATAPRIGGGEVAFGGAGSPLSHAVGVGMRAPVTAAELDAIEEYYRSRGTPINIDLCPLADPSLAELMGKRCYRIAEFNNVLVRAAQPVPDGEDARIRRAGEQDREAWSRTTMHGFLEREDVLQPEMDLAATLYGMPSGAPWLAEIDGTPVAAAGMAVRDGLAMLFGDATRPGYRNRGLHMALIMARMRYAAERGCDLITASTLPGSGSQRNYERLGFRVVYTKTIMLRE
jgi:GNAT superfamily N-acetyltransferase